jgi:ABC-type multidrug transport system fused ATPase/permease subunit
MWFKLFEKKKKTEEQRNQQRNFRKGIGYSFRSLTADRVILTRALVLLFLEGVAVALVPIAMGELLSNPVAATVTLMVSINAVQYYLLLWYMETQRLLGVVNADYLSMEIAKVVSKTSKQPLIRISEQSGQLHSSIVRNVSLFVANIPEISQFLVIIGGNLVAMVVLFGAGKYLFFALMGMLLMSILSCFSYRWNLELSRQTKKLDANQNNHFDGFINNLEVHQQSGATTFKLRTLKNVLDKQTKLYQRNEWMNALRFGWFRILPTLVFMWLIYITAISDKRSPADLSMLGICAGTAMQFSYQVVQSVLGLAKHFGDLQHLGQLLSAPMRPQGNRVLKKVSSLSLSTSLRVTFANGHVMFPNGLVPCNKQLTELRMDAGQFVVFVGEIGSGKSTVAKILARVYENLPEDDTQWTGSYQVQDNGREWLPVFDTNLLSFYRNVFHAPQTANYVDSEQKEIEWAPGTVRDNIGYFLRHEELSLTPQRVDELIWEAAELVGLQTQLKQEVRTLSGGELALCMLGRSIVGVLLGEIKVLILDETFANLNGAKAQAVLSNLRRLVKQYQLTIILVSHKDEFNPPDACAYVFGSNGKGIIEMGQVAMLRKRWFSQYNNATGRRSWFTSLLTSKFKQCDPA